jgi:hypothetical protein
MKCLRTLFPHTVKPLDRSILSDRQKIFSHALPPSCHISALLYHKAESFSIIPRKKEKLLPIFHFPPKICSERQKNIKNRTESIEK